MIGVLKNLRSAVQISQQSQALYCFITNGRRGRLDEFDAFLNRVRRAQNFDNLDDEEIKNFSNSVKKTDRKFFQYIEQKTRTSNTQSCSENYIEVFHLLSCFDMKFSVTSDQLILKIDKELRKHVSNRGDEADIRMRLIGKLMSQLQCGPLVLDGASINTIFDEHGLTPLRKEALEKLQQKMRLITTNRLIRRKYISQLDVRSSPDWPDDKPVLLIAGKSGVGKSWQLGCLLCSLMKDQQVVTIDSTTGQGEVRLTRAVCDIWKSGLGEGDIETVVDLANRLSDLDYSTRQLVLAFEDVRDISTARYLIDQDWSTLGIRLVLTVPKDVALPFHDDSDVSVHLVEEFSYQELGKVLSSVSRHLEELPLILRRVLRKPILAGIYLSLNYSSFEKSPQNEYEIFDLFWKLIDVKADKYDVGTVMALGAHVFKSKPYPISIQSWPSIQLDYCKLRRLENTGWFWHNQGIVSFAHERLLNWAVAKSFVSTYLVNQVPLSELGDSLATCVKGTLMYGSAELGYVPMDVLWLLAHEEKGRTILPHLVERLEQCIEFGSYGESLYTNLLPTLGECAIPIFRKRLHEIAQHDEHDYRLKLIGAGMIVLHNQEGLELKKVLFTLLNSSSVGSQNVALAVLAKTPIDYSLDSIWRLHKQRVTRLTTQSDTWAHEDYLASFDALRATIRMNPQWLRHRLVSEDEHPEALPALAYQLSILEDSNEQKIWDDTKESLSARMPRSKPRSLLGCIERFKDYEYLDFVIEHLATHEDFASSTAFSALVILNPTVALDHLVDVDDTQLITSRKRWLPFLLHMQPDLFRQRILEYAQSNSWGFIRTKMLFYEFPNEIDAPILEYLLGTLESELRELLGVATVDVEPSWLTTRLEFLCKLTRSKLLAVFETKKHGELEQLIYRIALNQSDRYADFRNIQVFENTYHVLMNIGGDFFGAFLRYQLASSNQNLRKVALRWSLVYWDRAITQSIKNVLRCHGGKVIDTDDLDTTAEFRLIASSFAQFGEDEMLVNVLEKFGPVAMTYRLPELRSQNEPMAEQFTSNARSVLNSPLEVEQDDQSLSALCVAWVSEDPDMIPSFLSTLREADPSSLVARLTCLGLDALGDVSEDFLELACRMLDYRDNAQFAFRALANTSVSGHGFINRWLECLDKTNFEPKEVLICAVRLLHNNRETRTSAINAAVEICRNSNQLLDLPFEIAAESSDSSMRDQIIEIAHDLNRIDGRHTVRAIQGLAKFELGLAVRALENAIRLGPVSRSLCLFYRSIASDNAVEFLVNTAITTKRTVLRQCIGLVLRRFDTQDVSDRVISYLQNGHTEHRKAAADVARWLLNSRMSTMLINFADSDTSTEVRISAVASIRAQGDEMAVRQLLELLPEVPEQRRWPILVAILNAGDPCLLLDPKDTLSLDRVLSKFPKAFTLHAEDALGKRQQKAGLEEHRKDRSERAAQRACVS